MSFIRVSNPKCVGTVQRQYVTSCLFSDAIAVIVIGELQGHPCSIAGGQQYYNYSEAKSSLCSSVNSN